MSDGLTYVYLPVELLYVLRSNSDTPHSYVKHIDWSTNPKTGLPKILRLYR